MLVPQLAELTQLLAAHRKGADGQPKIALILNDPSASSSSTSGPSSASSSTKPDIKGKRPASATDGVPTEYKLTMQNTSSKNLYVFGERIEDDVDTGDEGARRKRRASRSLFHAVAPQPCPSDQR